MPVARIVTRFAEEAAPLIGELRARGYTIELVDPGTFRVTPADLEIQLDRLRTPEALRHAVKFGREHDAEVFVAAGLPLDEEATAALRGAAARRNVLAEGFQRLLAPFRRLGAEVHDSRKARRQDAIDKELAREAEKKQRAEQKAAERAERARREQEEAERRRVEREAMLAREREAASRRQEEEARVARERAAAMARQRQEEARLAAEREAQLAARRREEESERQRREAEAARLSTEEQERRRVAQELAAAERERRLEEERQRAVAVAAALVEAQRREAERERARQRVAAVPAGGTPALQDRAGSRAMKRAFVAAAGLAVLITAGWGAYQNRAPAQPLSNQQRVNSNQIRQDVPFGAATIQPKPQPKQAATKPQPQPKTAQQKPAPASAPKTAPKRAQRYAADDVDVVAEDEIVYHGAPKNSKSRASAKPQQHQDGVKRISDLEDGEEE